MQRTIVVFSVCLLSLPSTGCKAKEAISQVIASHDVSARGITGVSARGITDVMNKREEEKYTPPADGHLTGDQIQNFMKIRTRAKVIENVARRDLAERTKLSEKENKSPSINDIIQDSRMMAVLVSADVRASQELGFNSAEYEWVKQQMLDASMAAVSDQGLVAGRKVFADDQADLQKHYDDAPDEPSKKIYAGLIADSKKNAGEAESKVEPQTPAVIYNKQLLAKYEDAGRPMLEVMLGGTGHEEEIQKGLSDLKKAVAGAPAKP